MYAVAAIGLGALLITFDFSVNVALPAITANFGGQLQSVQWIIIIYQSTIAALMLAWGGAGDRIGYRQVYLVGLAAFSLGSALCAAAPTLAMLVASRAVLGLGSGMILASTPALMSLTFGPAGRGRAMGWLAACAALGSLVGPLAGGWLVDTFGWRAVFSVRPPVGALAIVAALAFLPPAVPSRRSPFDGLGAALLAVATLTALLAIGRGNRWGWRSPNTLLLLALGLALFAAFVWRERQAGTPLVRLSVFRSLPFSASVASWTLSWLAVFGIWVLVPFYLEEGIGLSASAAGGLYAISAACMSVSSLISGHLTDRRGAYLPSLVGLAGTAVALLLIASLSQHATWVEAGWRLAVFGVFFGCFQAPNNAAVMAGVRPDELGVASGIISLSRYFGVVGGVALATSIFNARQQYYEAVAYVEPRLAAIIAQRDSFVVATAIAVAALLVAAAGRAAAIERQPHDA